jgi:DNA excision repair protein ERCC-2
MAGVQEPLLQLCCLDSSLAISPVFKRFKSVVITSGFLSCTIITMHILRALAAACVHHFHPTGTLSPIDLYPKLLNFHPVVRASLPMSTFRPCLLPLVVTRGSDQTPLSTKFDQRTDVSIVRNYGALLLNMAASVPDGICCFFTSYWYMEFIITKWDELGILQKV